MRVVLFSDICVRGGVLTWMLNMASGLRRAGHDPLLFFSRNHTAMSETESAGCEVILGTYGDLARICKARGVDVLHVNATAVPILEHIRHRLPRALRVVVTSHGWSRAGWFSTNCHAYCGVSREMCRQAARVSDIVPDLVLNGIDTERFCPGPSQERGRPIVAWSGRTLSLEQKNFPLFLAAARALYAAGIRIWVSDADGCTSEHYGVSVGPGELIESWETVPYGGMPDWYRAVAASGGLLVSTSRYEGLSMNQIEAQACGCPCMGPRVTGVVEAISEQHGGFLFPPSWDGDRIAEAILTQLADASAMRHRSRLTAEWARTQFSSERMVAEYLHIYARPSVVRCGAVRSLYLRSAYRLEHKLARPLARVLRGKPWSNMDAPRSG